MDKKLSEYILAYKNQLEIGDIQIAYEWLIKYVMTLKSRFENAFSNKYFCGNVSVGYMDFTYFPFFNEFLRSKKLRFGIVLNHKKMRFELWLMGQNAEVQKQYWDLLKMSKWSKNQNIMPKYSIVEVILKEELDFDNKDELTAVIIEKADMFSEEIINYIKIYNI